MQQRHVHVSRGISKLGEAIPSINLPAVETCRPDAPCARLCYARKGRFSMTHTAQLLSDNLAIWREDPQGFETAAIAAAYFARFFRWHSSGDIVDADYLAMMVRVANACPDTRFLCFTKKYELVNAFLSEGNAFPANLSMVFSAWGNFLPENPHNLPTAYIRFKKVQTPIPADALPCSGYCGACVQGGKSCWHLKSGQSVVFNQH